MKLGGIGEAAACIGVHYGTSTDGLRGRVRGHGVYGAGGEVCKKMMTTL